jgi:hypothetical protein
VPRLSLDRARRRAGQVARSLRAGKNQLQRLRRQLPFPPELNDRDLTAEGSAAAELGLTLQSVIADYLNPAIDALEEQCRPR